MSDCKDNEIKNNYTNECVLFDQSTELFDFFEQIKSQKEYTDLNEHINQYYTVDIIYEIAKQLKYPEEEIKFVYKLGNGSYGNVYIMNVRDEQYIVKIENMHLSNRPIEDLMKEYSMHITFFNLNFPVPTPYFFVHTTPFTVMGMQMNQFTVEVGMLSNILKTPAPPIFLDYITDAITDLLDKMRQSGLSHGDFHLGNIGIQNTANTDTNIGKQVAYSSDQEIIFISPLLIDFGFADETKEEQSIQVEITQLIRTLMNMKIDKSNRNYLYPKIRELFNRYNTFITGNMFPEIDSIKKPKDFLQYLNILFEFSRNINTKQYIYRTIYELYDTGGDVYSTFLELYGRVYHGKIGIKSLMKYLDLANEFIQKKKKAQLYRFNCLNNIFAIYFKNIVDETFFERLYEIVIKIELIENKKERYSYLEILYEATNNILESKDTIDPDVLDVINQLYSIILKKI